VQTTCPQCSQGIIIDDAKVPDRPFSVKCPRCRMTVRFPGKGGKPSAGAAPTPEPEPAEEPGTLPPMPTPIPTSSSAAPPVTVPDEVRSQVMAQLRREMSLAEPSTAGRALVCVSDRNLAGLVTLTLNRQGLAVDTLDDCDEGLRLLEQGVYVVLATTRAVAPQGKAPTLYQRLSRLNADARRRVFVVLLGDEFKSGDGTQAFAALVDLVVSSRDVAGCDNVLRAAMAERQRLFQAFLDARRRDEAAG
jgi:predicted Zn finger-like uncharacterized protein